jgi:hypothetical protein
MPKLVSTIIPHDILPRFRPAFGLRARLLYLIISCGVFSAL